MAEYYKAVIEANGEDAQILNLADLPQDFIFTATYGRKNEAFDRDFQDVIDNSSKFVFIVPEYNSSFPGVLKAFIDSLKFPHSFKNKVGALVGIASGIQAGTMAVSHLNDILNYVGMYTLPARIKLPKIEQVFIDGQIIDPNAEKMIQNQIKMLIAWQNSPAQVPVA